MKTNKQIKNVAKSYNLTLDEVQDVLKNVANKAGFDSNVFNSSKAYKGILKLKEAKLQKAKNDCYSLKPTFLDIIVKIERYMSDDELLELRNSFENLGFKFLWYRNYEIQMPISLHFRRRCNPEKQLPKSLEGLKNLKYKIGENYLDYSFDVFYSDSFYQVFECATIEVKNSELKVVYSEFNEELNFLN